MVKKVNIKIYPNPKMAAANPDSNRADKRSRIEQTKTYNFVEFSQIPEYRDVNKDLLKSAIQLLPKNLKALTHVDNASGTGLIPQLAIEVYRSLGIQATIIGIDPDLYALQRAEESIQDLNNSELLLIQGYGQDLQELLKGHIPPEGVDIVSIHDAIHEIPGRETKRKIFAAQAKILKKGGVQTYNSAFTTVGMGDAAMKWGRWKLDAFSFFKQGRNRNIQAIEVYSPDEYKQMITDSGLKIIHENIKTVMLSYNALKAISQYPEFVNGVFRDMEHVDDYTLLQKSQALIASLDKQEITALPRQWHEIIAKKP